MTNMIWNTDEEFTCGIDPGESGTIIFGTKDRRMIMFDCSDYYSDKGLLGFSLALRYSRIQGKHIWMEDVHGIPGQKGSSNFDQNIGLIKGVMVAHGIQFQLVSPQKWQLGLGLGGGKLEYKDRKQMQCEEATKLFPTFQRGGKKVISKKYADALLILEYGYRQRYGDPIKGVEL